MPRGPQGTRVSLTIPPGLEQRLTQAPKVAREMARVVSEIADLADQTCPVGTEPRDDAHRVHLRDTLDSEVLLTPQGAVGVIAYWAYWAHFVHNGTSRQVANPWLLNAALAVMVGQRRAA